MCTVCVCVLYLIQYIRELPQFAELHEVQPRHVKDPFGWFLRAGLQVQRCTSWKIDDNKNVLVNTM